jgi:class 3 adenylate cyclase
VSVLFCDLVGFTAASDGADPEEVQAALSPYHARARTEIERFGGTVEKFIGDAVMAAFGAPVVHEDDPERAVRAGLALLGAVDDLNRTHRLDLAVRIGIATGEAVVSTGARPERGEGMLAGDVVNTAARLQTSAPVGAVLLGQSTRDATRAAIEYEPHEPVTVKGKSGPLPVWVAVRARGYVGEALTEASQPMVGRDDELSALQRAYSRAVREDSVQLVTIVAEPGLGKSRLVQAFSGWVDAREELVTWRQGRCPSYGDAVTYAALGEIVKAQTAILDTDSPEVATAKLTDTVHALVDGTDLAPQESWLVARLAPLVGLQASGTSQEELFTAWRRFLETLAMTSPLILVFEDLHWADPAMLDFLTHLLEWVVGFPLVIIATTRPELYDTAEHWGSGHRNSTTLTLLPLSDAENAQVVTSLLGTAVLPADLHAALLAKAAGTRCTPGST